MRSFKVFILIILLGLMFPNNTYAGKQELTPENVIQVSAIGATKGEFCRLSANANEVKSFHNNILTTQYSDEKYYKLFEEIPCESETKEIIYGSLEIIRNTPDRDVLYPQVFLIDDEIIRPGGWVDFYKYESSIIDQNKVFDSMLEMNRQYHPSIHYSYKGTRAIKLWTLPIEDETKTPFYKDNTLVFEDSAVTLKSGFFVHLDESGLIDQFYIFHNNSIYRHVKSIREIRDLLLVDYSNSPEVLTPTPDVTLDWNIYQGEGFVFKYPRDWIFKSDNSNLVFTKNVSGLQPTGSSTSTPAASPKEATIYFNLYKNTQNFSLDEWTRNEATRRGIDMLGPIFTHTTVAGLDARDSVIPEKYLDNGQRIVVFMRDNNVFVISYKITDSKDALIKGEMEMQIRDTFKFTSPSDPTANWKLYNGNGFGFKYPSEWSYKTTGELVEFSKRIRSAQPTGSFENLSEYTAVYFKTTRKGNDETIDNWAQKEITRRGLSDFKPKIEKAVVAGVEAIETEFPSRYGENLTVFLHNNNVYVLTLEYSTTDDELAQKEFKNQFLSTFKFSN